MNKAEKAALLAFQKDMKQTFSQRLIMNDMRDGFKMGYEQAMKDFRKELFKIGLSSNPMDYVKWVADKIKEIDEQ